jgi:mRNA-degrading endonuclease YafQ of YafQ-DinJ toxin-antitoxin module
MWRLGRTDTFVRTARRLVKRDPRLKPHLQATLGLLELDPHHPRLKLHQLRGALDGLWAVRVTYRIRLVLTLDEESRQIILLDIGSHDEVYR